MASGRRKATPNTDNINVERNTLRNHQKTCFNFQRSGAGLLLSMYDFSVHNKC